MPGCPVTLLLYKGTGSQLAYFLLVLVVETELDDGTPCFSAPSCSLLSFLWVRYNLVDKNEVQHLLQPLAIVSRFNC